jgi:hypothetical protein
MRILPRWKARALALAEIQTVVNAVTPNDSTAIRNDDAGVGANQLRDEGRVPSLAPMPRNP